MKSIHASCFLRLGLLAICSLPFAIAPSAHAQVGYPASASLNFWSGKGKTATSNTSYFVTSALYRPARVDFISYSSTNVGTLTFYSAGSSLTITQASGLGTNTISLSSTSSLAVADVIVIRSVANDTYQMAVVNGFNSSGVILTNTLSTLLNPVDFATVSGDKVYKMTAAGLYKTPIGTNTLSSYSGCLWNAQEGLPALIVYGGTAAQANSTLDLVSGTYQRP
jgi:hypothetical protein